MFADYFQLKGHQELKSSPIVPQGDNTLMFINSGMAPLKELFNGTAKLPDGKLNAFSVQACLRAGGKHNDLDNVGYTFRHHTLFEMMGNFSFGGYFKKEAIAYAWEFLTSKKYLGQFIDINKLYFTVYIDDNESFDLWHELLTAAGLDCDKHLLKVDSEDNFWSVGETGLCGPCTEIYYDHEADKSPNFCLDELEKGDRYVEIWNLVFTQFNRNSKGQLEPLATKCVDTGIGLERLMAIIQNKVSNYDSSVFALEDLVAKLSNSISYKNLDEEQKVSLRVMIDHARALLFLVHADVNPSNEGRGYVLRRIMRRSIRHLFSIKEKISDFSGHDEILKHAANCLSPAYSLSAEKAIAVYNEEKEMFANVLSKGMAILNKAIASNSNSIKDGSICFELYDTYGFPLDFTQNELRLRGIEFDEGKFDELMLRQKNHSKLDRNSKNDSKNDDIVNKLQQIEAQTKFVGYGQLTAKSKIVAIVNSEGELVDGLKQGEKGWLYFDQTPLYPEGGGQLSDSGLILINKQSAANLIHVKKYNGHSVAHHVQATIDIAVGNECDLQVDSLKRINATAHHSATHLLHEALSAVLGYQVQQKGSQVYTDKLRFDYNTKAALTAEEVTRVENLINNTIMACADTEIVYMDREEASKAGFIGQFEDKYGKEVRTVTIGTKGDSTLLSSELCGGTHVSNTYQIGGFKITSQSSVGSGIKRIEAVCGSAALQYYTDKVASLIEIKDCLGVQKIEDTASKVKDNIEEIAAIKNDLLQSNIKSLKGLKNSNVISLFNVDKNAEKEIVKKVKNEHSSQNNFLVFNDKVIAVKGAELESSYKDQCLKLADVCNVSLKDGQFKGFSIAISFNNSLSLEDVQKIIS